MATVDIFLFPPNNLVLWVNSLTQTISRNADDDMLHANDDAIELSQEREFESFLLHENSQRLSNLEHSVVVDEC